MVANDNFRASPCDEGSQRKRRKISQACDQCRTRKSRCDGAKPVCKECAQRPNQKTRCRYSSNQDKNASHDEYVSSLLARIEELESQNQSSSNHQEIAVPSVPPTAPPARPHNSAEYYNVNDTSSPVSTQRAHLTSLNSAEKTSPVDAMGANAAAECAGDGHENRFYGGSSAVSLMRQVYRTLSRGDTMSRAASPGHVQTYVGIGSHFGSRLNLESVQQLSVLPRPLMDQALETYWQKVHHLYPFIYKPTFMQAYERLWTSEEMDDGLVTSSIGILGSKDYGPNSIVFHCALNLMLALATQFMDLPVDEKSGMGHIFAERSRNLCKLDLFDDGSLAVIQTLLIMTQYLQSTPYPSRCWNCIGITCRLAQGLALHCETPQNSRGLSLIEIEIRRRVWHGCVMLDTVVSMTLGRPLMLYEFQTVPLPQAADDHTLSQMNTECTGQISSMHFYVESLKVYKLLAEVAVKVYGKSNINPAISDNEPGFQTLFHTISNIDTDLTKVESNFPDHLHPERRFRTATEIRDSPMFSQQAFVLNARVVHMRVLLYLPIFMRYCHSVCTQDTIARNNWTSDSSPTGLSRVIVQSISAGCIENATKLIDIVHKSSQNGTTGAWWYNLLYIRTASVVVLLAMASKNTCLLVDAESIDKSWTKCKEALTYLQNFSHTSATCLHELEQLFRCVNDFKARHENSEDTNNGQLNDTTDPGYLSEAPVHDAFMGSDELGWSFVLDTTLFDDLFRFNPGPGIA